MPIGNGACEPREEVRVSLASASIKNPVFAWMLMAGFIVFGAISVMRLPVGQYPDVDFPVISISLTLEGASPEIMETDVVDILEDAVMAVEGIREINSTCRQNSATITIEFSLDRDIDLALQDVQARVSQATRKLPKDLEPASINKSNPEENPFMWVALSGTRPQQEISDYAQYAIKDKFQTVDGNGEVMLGGHLDRNLRIWVDAKKLEQLGLSADDLLKAAEREHVDAPAGRMEGGFRESNIEVETEALNLEDFNKIVIATRNGAPVYMKDVALVEDGFEDRRRLARSNGLPAQGLGIIKQHGANTVAVADGVRKRVEEVKPLLPEGLDIAVRVDQSQFIKDSITEMKHHIVLAVLLTAFVCWLFLGSLSSTFNVVLSIPVSIFGTFGVMYFMGFSLNTFTLLALTLSIGIVVDDAVMVLENIYRHAEMGKDRVTAARDGAEQISFAALAATLAIIAIFLPVAFMSGIIGKFFFQFGVVLSVAVAISLLEALTLAPARCSQFLSVGERSNFIERGVGWAFTVLSNFYRAVLSRLIRFRNRPLAFIVLGVVVCLAGAACVMGFAPIAGLYTEGAAMIQNGDFDTGAYRLLMAVLVTVMLPAVLGIAVFYLTRPSRAPVGAVLVLAGSVAFFIGSLAIIQQLKKEMVPAQDQGFFLVRVVGPVGSNLDYSDTVMTELENRLEKYKEISGIWTVVGGITGDVNNGLCFITLYPRDERERSQQQLILDLRKDLEDNAPPGCRVMVQDQSQNQFSADRRGGAQIQFVLRGPSWDTLGQLSDTFMDDMRSSNFFTAPDTSYRKGMPEIQVIPDRSKALANNVDMQSLAQTVSVLVGGQRLAYFKQNGRRYDIRARLLRDDRLKPEDIGNLFIRNNDGKLIRINEIASIVTRPSLQQITRQNRERAVTISANPSAGKSQGEALAYVESMAKDKLPPGYSMVLAGSSRTFTESMDSLVFALVLGLIVAYMVLASQFNSFIHPVTILLSLPFSLSGALIGLFVMDQSLNIYSMIGLVLLMGIVKKNSILLVDYTNQLREAGQNLEDALTEACPTRLRPILMTSLATIASAVPGAFIMGPGSELRVPLSISVIFGLSVSTVLTLFVVPCFYYVIDDFKRMVFENRKPQPQFPAVSTSHAKQPATNVAPGIAATSSALSEAGASGK
jgi:multidrug efflux pump subunit AcrB